MGAQAFKKNPLHWNREFGHWATVCNRYQVRKAGGYRRRSEWVAIAMSRQPAGTFSGDVVLGRFATPAEARARCEQDCEGKCPAK